MELCRISAAQETAKATGLKLPFLRKSCGFDLCMCYGASSKPGKFPPRQNPLIFISNSKVIEDYKILLIFFNGNFRGVSKTIKKKSKYFFSSTPNLRWEGLPQCLIGAVQPGLCPHSPLWVKVLGRAGFPSMYQIPTFWRWDKVNWELLILEWHDERQTGHGGTAPRVRCAPYNSQSH